MKKILITYVSYGSGHKTIANYIKDYITNDNLYEIKIVDLLDYMGNTTMGTVKLFDYIYNHRMETLFNVLYKATNHELVNKGYKGFLKHFIYNKNLEKMFCDFNPDIVLSTHFYGSNIASLLIKKGLINPKVITLVTDYKIHKMWMSSYNREEIFIVASDLVKMEMEKRNCYSKNICVFGLPYNIKKIHDMLPVNSIYKKYNIPDGYRCLLFFGGGSNGSLAYYKYLKRLMKLYPNYEVLFVCGKNKKLLLKTNLLKQLYKNLHVYGFITNVYELMEISEMIITKPGGATVTECLEMQKMMCLLPGIGGQEKYNAKFVVKNNYGYMVHTSFGFKRIMKKYFNNPAEYMEKYNTSKLNNESLNKIRDLVYRLCYNK